MPFSTLLRSGGAWRLLPHEFPPWSAVYCYFRTLRQQGVWQEILCAVRFGKKRKERRHPARRSLTANQSRRRKKVGRVASRAENASEALTRLMLGG